ncbi:hypothetical protein Tco_0951609 [Tanacetum coccineum]|uniref:Tf2-1-like SH3-like domain-containing protein n=1 Tax=Tanacetum coccineum TaxID=301880 RepID=A0ABQ5E1D5_9ASTR
MHVARECTYSDFLKCQPLNLRGTKGVVGLTQWFEKMESVFHISSCTVTCQVKFATCTLLGNALTWWNSYVKTVGHDAAYGMPWQTLMKMLTDKMFPEESDQVEKYVRGLHDMIQGSVMASKPKTMQDAIEFATELMDQKIRTFAKRQAENKRKLENDNQAQRQPPKRQKVARAYSDLSRVLQMPILLSTKEALGQVRRLLAMNVRIKGTTGTDHLCIQEGPCHAGSSRRHLIPNPKPRSRDTSLVALGKSAIKFARQKSYADVRRKPVKFQVDNLVMLKGLERVESIAYKLKLPQELSRVHNTFHISNLKKCCSDDPLAIPLEGLHIDDKFHLVEEPVVIMDRDIKRLKSKPSHGARSLLLVSLLIYSVLFDLLIVDQGFGMKIVLDGRNADMKNDGLGGPEEDPADYPADGGDNDDNESSDDDNDDDDNKRQNTGKAYTAGHGEKKHYGGSKPLYFKYNYHHNGSCAPKCHKCNRVGHLTRDWHYRSDCPELKNQNHENGDRLGPFKGLERVESIAYKLKLPQELSRVHNAFHVSNLKKCCSEDPLVVPLEGLHVDDKLHFVEEPVEIMNREVKQLRRSRVPIVKVRWNSRRGP